MLKVVSDVFILLVIGTIPYVLAWSRLNRVRAKEALYEGARRTAGAR